MADAGWALQQAVYGALASDAALIALLGGPKIYDDAPHAVAHPYVTLGQSVERDWSTGTEDGAEHVLTVHVWSRAAGRRETRAIMAAARSALHEAALSPAGTRLVSLRHELSEARREADGETWHGIVRFRALTEPAGG